METDNLSAFKIQDLSNKLSLLWLNTNQDVDSLKEHVLVLFSAGPQTGNCTHGGSDPWLLCKTAVNHMFMRFRDSKICGHFSVKLYLFCYFVCVRSNVSIYVPPECNKKEWESRRRPYLNQVLVHPFCEGLFLYSISFICKTETTPLNTRHVCIKKLWNYICKHKHLKDVMWIIRKWLVCVYIAVVIFMYFT